MLFQLRSDVGRLKEPFTFNDTELNHLIRDLDQDQVNNLPLRP
ncbi:MAG: hypothetical protein ACK5WP_05455 [Neisseriaceae bacterium]